MRRAAPFRNPFSLPVVLTALLSLTQIAHAVKHGDFKTCSQSGFCKRNRALADQAVAAGSAFTSPYELDSSTVKLNDGVLTGTIWKTVSEEDGGKVELPVVISFLDDGVARLTVDEARRQKGDIEIRGDSKARKERYNEAEKWALVGGQNVDPSATLETRDGGAKVAYGPSGYEVRIDYKPFKVSFWRDNEPHIVFNDRHFMNIEHWRPKQEKKDGEEGSGEDESTWWEETFGGNTDSKPKGPEAVALDITFPGYEHVYGIPEHASSLSLKETRGGEGNYEEPYRLYNTDVFEYEIDSPMTLYGAIPFMQAHKKGSTVGVFWLNGAETWVDIIKQQKNPLSLSAGKMTTATHWISESGLLDVFIVPGPTPNAVTQQYGALTGNTVLPPTFSIAYHQCRWNYVSQDDVKDVDKNFDKFDIPYDVIWLDIEYTDGKKYFTWDPLTFSDPVDMQNTLAKRDRKLVAIIDPHIKNVKDYSVSDDMEAKGLSVKQKTAEKSYEGWCWPGSSHWVDCFNPESIKWWKDLFSLKNFPGATRNLHIWNDMNEPSVFNGPETTMPKDNLHYGNWEHRDVHNINGMTFHNATYEGMIERAGKGKEERPFILTRSYYAGSQRTVAMWTGDNQANWDHLEQSFPMILQNGISGFPFSGADVAGFFGNPSWELFSRWYQAGAFYPFFRGHAHIDAKRREPYLAPEPHRSIVRDALRLRYSLLPAWYTAFHAASTEGTPIIKPQFVVFPDDEAGFAIDDQFFLGNTGLLVKPVVKEGATEADVYVVDDEPHYEYNDYTVYKGKGYHKMPAPMETIPMLMRGGHIIPRRDRHRRSSGLMKHDPFTLVVNLDSKGAASGTLYIDDGETFKYREGAYIHRSFGFSENTLASSNLHEDSHKFKTLHKEMDDLRVEKVIVVGVGDDWVGKKTVEVKQGDKTWEADITVTKGSNGKANSAVVRDPKVKIQADWSIAF